MKFAENVQIVGNWQFEHFRACVDPLTKKRWGRHCVITAGANGKHSDKSKHYEFRAWDVRVWVDEFKSAKGRHTNDECEHFARELRALLGSCYDVVVHYDSTGSYVTHIHVEYDKK